MLYHERIVFLCSLKFAKNVEFYSVLWKSFISCVGVRNLRMICIIILQY